MKRKFGRSFSLLVLILLVSCYAVSWASDGKISGYVFGDYYYVLKSHKIELEDRNGFQHRRIYLQYDRGLSDEFTVRLRLEMNGASFPDDKIKIEPFVKHGYLKWTKKDWRTNTYFGLSSTPTWNVIEKVWGYRSVAKNLLDLQKLGSSTDFAAAVQGSFDSAKKLSYHVMVGNGNSTSAETDDDKKLYASLTARPVEGVIVEAYADFESRDEDKNRYVLQGLVAYQGDKFRIGAQIANQTRQQGEGPDDLDIMAGSVFGAAQIIEKKVWAFARFDRMFDPNPDAAGISYIPFDETAESNTIIAGLDWTPIKDVHIMPNLVAVFYDEPDTGDKPDETIMPRLTVYFKY